jgi:Spy/CpxP family protein refolding chaperone
VKWKALIVLFGVFLLGVAGGVAFDRAVLHPYGPPPEFRGRHRHGPPVGRILQRLTSELSLSQAQQHDVRQILMATRTELKTARQHMRKRVDEILKASETRIHDVLKPEQRAAFERFMVEHRARREQRRHWRRHHRSEEHMK